MIERVQRKDPNSPDPNRLTKVCAALAKKLALHEIGDDPKFLELAVSKAKEFFSEHYHEEYRGELWQEILASREFLFVADIALKEKTRAAYSVHEDMATEIKLREIVQAVAEQIVTTRLDGGLARKLDPFTWKFKPYKDDVFDLRLVRLNQITHALRHQNEEFGERLVPAVKQLAAQKSQGLPPR